MKNRATTWKILLLAGWLAGILLPLYSMRRFSSSYRTAFDFVFHTHASHVITHTFLYAALACIVASLIPAALRKARPRFFIVIAIIAVVAALQESIQMLSESVSLGSDEIFDFFVDLNGGTLGAMLYLSVARRRNKRREQPDTAPQETDT